VMIGLIIAALCAGFCIGLNFRSIVDKLKL